ncbi:c-type cytochrome biogenesis protein CcsB [Thioalkalivibrio denitrificans]|uniref:C-type cytochrome biogenesis protein CcsB n=1 Tax=Thioalkalivibrio denitrificans TaxID=108003 RepID=A0A1V3ND95_9GAMM|nr:c-type cytochrome biogenesis protein CcsB [Thioalkalivibrio denitrificans]OOG22954.1 c-type cytochrome biogenesis protein CcsB [Thioalkalivibrio denitrificans]
MSVPHEAIEIESPGFFRSLSTRDWAWGVFVVAATTFILAVYGERMDRYEIGVLLLSAGGTVWMGWYWRAFQPYAIVVGALSLIGVLSYGGVFSGTGDLARNETNFFLKYLVSGQSATMWMCALYFAATTAYLASLFRYKDGTPALRPALTIMAVTGLIGAGFWYVGSSNMVSGVEFIAPMFLILTAAAFIGLFARSDFPAQVGTALAWAGSVMGLAGLFVRWRETFLHDATWGYIPVSNLYEVFILFAVMTTLMYLYYEQRSRSQAMGGFVMLVVSASVAFLLWYITDRQAHIVEPLVPALQSWWMKIHVPTNFVGYGGFAIAAMLGVAYLLRARGERVNPNGLLATRLPSREVIDDVSYKAIAIGFAFFTIATILGALWAAEAWGGYWSWDPKETWALIVWLNYAAWLHMRFTKGWRGVGMAWWSIGGLFITTFAFLGVNMFLSGLHSYGEL